MKNDRGAAIVEFAIVLPLLIILVFGIIEFALILYDKAVITNASREGARAGIVMANPRITEGDISGIASSYCNHLISLKGAPAPIITVDGAGGSFPDNLTVTVRYDYGFLVIPKFVTALASIDPIPLSATTVMRME